MQNKFARRSPLWKIILQSNNQKNIVDSQFRKLHNNAAVINGNVHDVIAHAQWFVSVIKYLRYHLLYVLRGGYDDT